MTSEELFYNKMMSDNSKVKIQANENINKKIDIFIKRCVLEKNCSYVELYNDFVQKVNLTGKYANIAVPTSEIVIAPMIIERLAYLLKYNIKL